MIVDQPRRAERTLCREIIAAADASESCRRPLLCSTEDAREATMADSVYKVIELVGTSTESWEKAASAAVARASKTLRDLRVAEIDKLDMQMDENGKVEAFRAKLKVSFKYED